MPLPLLARLTAVVMVAVVVWVDSTRANDLYILTVGVEPDLTAKGQRDPYAGDAWFVRRALAQAEPLHTTTHSRVLAGKQANRAQVLEALAWLGKSVGERDLAVVFFSAHGSMDASKGYRISLLGSGGTEKSGALWGSELNAALGKVRGRTVLLLDTCSAGGVIQADGSKGHKAAVVAACKATESSDGQWEKTDRPHGWFVIALCEALGGLADANRDGVVTLAEVHAYLPDRAKRFYRRQNAVVLPREELLQLPLARLDPGHPSTELWTVKPVKPGRNPFGEPDVPDPDGKDVQAFARTVKLDGGDQDPNAVAWHDRTIAGVAGSLDGRWASRWNGGSTTNWVRGTAEIRSSGGRVYILFDDAYLIDVKPVGAGGRLLVGRYSNLTLPNDTSPWVGRVYSDGRIDGQWSEGRWDLRRTIRDGD